MTFKDHFWTEEEVWLVWSALGQAIQTMSNESLVFSMDHTEQDITKAVCAYELHRRAQMTRES